MISVRVVFALLLCVVVTRIAYAQNATTFGLPADTPVNATDIYTTYVVPAVNATANTITGADAVPNQPKTALPSATGGADATGSGNKTQPTTAPQGASPNTYGGATVDQLLNAIPQNDAKTIEVKNIISTAIDTAATKLATSVAPYSAAARILTTGTGAGITNQNTAANPSATGQQTAPSTASPNAANVIDQLRKDHDLQESTQELGQVGKSVRAFQKTIETSAAPLVAGTAPSPASIPTKIAEAPKVAQAVEDLTQRDGLDLFKDSDSDGVSDYDEVHLYGTDPNNAHTSGSSLTDGARILQGLDVHGTSDQRVPVQSPIDAGTVSRELFEVTSISVVSATTSAASPSPNDAALSGSSTDPRVSLAPGPLIGRVTFDGKGLPNSFVTLYIFSTPIVVTVKTDANGNWKYTLDSELPDGNHNLYVAMVNNEGKIIAKSPAVPFTKRAEAIEYVPLVLPPITEPTFVDTLRDNIVVVAAMIILIFGGVAVGFLGLRRQPQGVA